MTEIKSGTYWEIHGKDCLISLEKRPHYCDRGNYLAKIYQKSFLLGIDDQDGWPRYYFKLENAVEEIKEWLIKRKQFVDENWTEQQ